MKKFQKSALALSLMLSFAVSAEAAYLGQLTVQSQAHQNFQATFLVHDVAPNGTSLTARLAPEEVYRQYKMVMPESAKGLSLALINKNPLTLRISAHSPAQERAFPLLVELNEGGQKTVRQYNIHLGATGTVEPVAVQVKAEPIAQPEPSVAAIIKQAEPVKPAQAAPVKKAVSSTQTPLERMQAQNYDLSRPIVIEHGYTPWSLGVLYQKLYPQASVNQVLVALAVHNPQAFPAGNVRQLKAGAQLSAPSKDLVMSIDRKAAQEIVQKGLTIEEVASRPQPIAQPVAKTQPKKPAVKPQPKVEQPAVAPVEEVKPAVQPEPKAQPEVKSDIPVVETPHFTDPKTPAAETTLPQEPLTQLPPAEEVKPADPAPTLEIMTEEEEVVQEESTSWGWYLLILALLGGAGFLYWNTKKGGRVNLNSFKSFLEKKTPQVRQEPAASATQQPTAQTVHQPVSEPVQQSMTQEFKGQTLEEVTPQTVVHREEVKLVEVVEPVQATVSTEHPKDASNIFDLVGEADVEEPAPASVQNNSATAGQSMKDSLDMARSFIAIEATREAFELLQQVIKNGTPEEKAVAEVLMKQVRK